MFLACTRAHNMLAHASYAPGFLCRTSHICDKPRDEMASKNSMSTSLPSITRSRLGFSLSGIHCTGRLKSPNKMLIAVDSESSNTPFADVYTCSYAARLDPGGKYCSLANKLKSDES